MENSPLMKLPAELRNDIYELVLTRARPIELEYDHDRRRVIVDIWDDAEQASVKPSPSGYLTALPSTCRALRTECSSLIYTNNTFTFYNVIYPGFAVDYFGVFSDTIGKQNTDELRSVIFDAGYVGEAYPETFEDLLLTLLHGQEKASAHPSCVFTITLRFKYRPLGDWGHSEYTTMELRIGRLDASWQANHDRAEAKIHATEEEGGFDHADGDDEVLRRRVVGCHESVERLRRWLEEHGAGD